MNFIKQLFKFGGESDFGKVRNAIISIIGFILIILIWHYISSYEIIPTKILPDPFKMVGSIPKMITEDHLFANIWFTVKLNLICYIYAIVLSFPIGFAIACLPAFNLLFGRPINTIRFIPFSALTGLAVAMFGLTFNMKVWFLTGSIMVYIIPAIVNTINNLQNVKNEKDNIYLQTMKTLGGNNWQQFRYVYWPYVMSNVIPTFIDLLAVSYTYCVIAELIYKDGNVMGIGALITLMIRRSAIPEAFALLFIIVIIGALQDFLLKKVYRKVYSYRF